VSETTIERLKRLNDAAGQKAPVTATQEWWSRVACCIDEAFGDGVLEMSDYELGFALGGIVWQMMKDQET
jgi:hypothetical protein